MEQFFTKLKRGMVFLLSWISAILLVAMSFLVIYQVFTRYVLNSPSDFTEEIVRYLLIWTGFMGAAYGFCTRQHMALLLLHNKMTPEKRRFLMIFVDICICSGNPDSGRYQACTQCQKRILSPAGHFQKPGIQHGSDFRSVYHGCTAYQYLGRYDRNHD